MATLRFCLVFLLLVSFVGAYANEPTVNFQLESEVSQAPTNGASSLQKQPTPKAGVSTAVGWMSSLELWLSVSVLLFGLITLLIEISVIKSGDFKPDDSIKLLAVTLIVISTLFIITAGFDSEQIAPAMGLFGTVAGYMLGKVTPVKEG